MEATPGEAIDVDRVRRRINELYQKHPIRQVALDRRNATQLATQLDADGFEQVAFGQSSAGVSVPTKKLEELILSGQLVHRGHQVLPWMPERLDRAGCSEQLEAVEKVELRAD